MLDFMVLHFDDHRDKLPNWNQAARMVAFFQPCSAAIERVFFCSNHLLFRETKGLLEGDLIELTVILQCNEENE